MKLSDFIKQSNIPAKLIRSTVKQAGGWKEFKSIASDVCVHGADTGMSGFIYYTETVPFTTRNKKEIIALMKVYADDVSEASYLTWIANNVGLSIEDTALALFTPDHEEKYLVYNYLAWFALEDVALDYTRAIDEA